MSLHRFTYLRHSENLARLSLITPSSEDTRYPRANIVAMPISLPFRTAEGITTATIRFDLGNPEGVDTVALVDHDLSSSATALWKGAATPGGSTFSQAISWRDRTMPLFLSATQTFRHWTLDITDDGNEWGRLSIGYLIFGLKNQESDGFEVDWKDSRETFTRRARSVTRVPLPGKRLSTGKIIELAFTAVADADLPAMDDWLSSLKGGEDPLLFSPTALERDCYFGRMFDDYGFQRGQALSIGEGMKFEEDPISDQVSLLAPLDFEA